MKTCTRCKQQKSLDDFNKRSVSKDGKDIYCKPCRSTILYSSRINNSNKCTWKDCEKPHNSNGLCQMHYVRKQRGTDMDLARDYTKRYEHIKRNYKLDKDKYDEMCKDGCYICGSKEFLNVDHDHACCQGTKSCGKCVRGVVCHSCNNTLGKLERGTIAFANELKPKLYQYLIDFENRKKKLG